MKKTQIPADLRGRFEKARLDTLALIRSIDRLDLSPVEIPQLLIQELFQLDADCAEALWGLDQPPKSLDFKAMLTDTLASLEDLPVVESEFLAGLPLRAKAPLAKHRTEIRRTLTLDDAYSGVPGRDPLTG